MHVIVVAALLVNAGLAAPPVRPVSTTTLTTSGRTALTYTGYMNGESFQQDGIVTFQGRQYAAFWDESGHVNVSRRLLAIRTGLSGAGDETLYEYARGTWTHLGRFIEGTAGNVNPCLFGIEYDGTGLLHATWTVRETPDASTNHDIFYAYSKDKGRTWRTNAGTVVAKPLTANAGALRVWSIPQNRGLINQESQVVDHAGNVHVLASHLPAAAPGNTNFSAARESAVLVHYRRDKASKAWRQTCLAIGEGSSRGDLTVDAGEIDVQDWTFGAVVAGGAAVQPPRPR